jgi:hypothetical protein
MKMKKKGGGGGWFPSTWAEPNPKTYFFMELSLSTESYKRQKTALASIF